MASRFWVPGGNGSVGSSTNWSTVSGGASGASAPVAGDDAYWDAASGSGQVKFDSAFSCRHLDATGSANSAQMGAFTTTVTGHLRFTFGGGVTATGTHFLSHYPVDSNGGTGYDLNLPTWPTTNTVTLNLGNNAAAQIELRAAIVMGSGSTFSRLGGAVNTNDYAITAGAASSTGTTAKTGSAGASVVTLLSTNTAFSVSGSGDTWNVSGATFVISATANNTVWPSGWPKIGTIKITSTGYVLVGSPPKGVGTLVHNSTAGQLNGAMLGGSFAVDNWQITGPTSKPHHAVLIASTGLYTPRVITTTGSRGFTGNVNFRDITIIDGTGGTVDVSDSFNRANGALGTTDSYLGGSAQTWTVQSGTWAIASNTVSSLSGAGNQFATVPSSADVKVQATIAATPAAGAGVVARYLDANNWVRCYVDPSLNIYVTAMVAGVQVLNQQAGSITVGETLGLLICGGDLSVQRNGTAIYGVRPTSMPEGTDAGLAALGTFTSALDSFSVRPLPVGWDASARDDIGDELGNTGITFPASLSLTRDGTTGTWETLARWAIYSGSGTPRVPLPQDDVRLTATSGGISISASADSPGRLCRNLHIEDGYTGTWALTSSNVDYQIFGDTVRLGTGMTWTAANTVYTLLRRRGDVAITCNAKSFFPATSNGRVGISCPGGIVEFVDDFLGRNTANNQFAMSVAAGRIRAPNRTIDIGYLTLPGTLTRGFEQIDGATFICYSSSAGSSIFDGGGFTGLQGTLVNTTIKVATASTNARNFVVPWLFHVGTVEHIAAGPNGSLALPQGGWIKKLSVKGGNTIRITPAVCPHIEQLDSQGSAGNLVNFISSVGGTKADVQFCGPPQNPSYVAFTDIRSAVTGKLGLGTGSTQSNCEALSATALDPAKPHIKCVTQNTAAYIGTLPLSRPFDAGSPVILYQAGAASYGPPAGYTLLRQSATAVTQRSYTGVASGGERQLVTTSTAAQTFVVELGGVGNAPTFQSAENTSASTAAIDAGNGGPTGAVDDLAIDLITCASTLGAHVSVSGGFTVLNTVIGSQASGIARGTSKLLDAAGAVASTLTWTTARAAGSQRILVRYGNVSNITFTPGRIDEADTARPVATLKRLAPGLVVEPESARTVSYRKRRGPELIVETDTARPAKLAKQIGPGLAVEAPTVFAVRNTKRSAPSVVAEIDAALGVAISGPAAGNKPGRFGSAPIGHLVTASPGRTIGVQIGHLED